MNQKQHLQREESLSLVRDASLDLCCPDWSAADLT